MNLIVAADKNWGIGYEGKLLTYLPNDLKYFKKRTVGKTVVMGRTTLESLPNSKPLVNRTNIVLSRNSSYSCQDTLVFHSIDSLIDYIKNYESEDVFVIGGAEIYTQLMSYCQYAYITKIHSEFKVDKYLPNFDELEEWTLESSSEMHDYKGIQYQFTVYRNTQQ